MRPDIQKAEGELTAARAKGAGAASPSEDPRGGRSTRAYWQVLGFTYEGRPAGP